MGHQSDGCGPCCTHQGRQRSGESKYLPLSGPGTTFSPLCAHWGRTEPRRGRERVSKAQLFPGGAEEAVGTLSIQLPSHQQECEREKVTSPWFCVSSQPLFFSFLSPSFLAALSAPEHSVLCWGIKRRQLKLFSEALKGHENTHITGAESPGASSGKKAPPSSGK